MAGSERKPIEYPRSLVGVVVLCAVLLGAGGCGTESVASVDAGPTSEVPTATTIEPAYLLTTEFPVDDTGDIPGVLHLPPDFGSSVTRSRGSMPWVADVELAKRRWQNPHVDDPEVAQATRTGPYVMTTVWGNGQQVVGSDGDQWSDVVSVTVSETDQYSPQLLEATVDLADPSLDLTIATIREGLSAMVETNEAEVILVWQERPGLSVLLGVRGDDVERAVAIANAMTF